MQLLADLIEFIPCGRCFQPILVEDVLTNIHDHGCDILRNRIQAASQMNTFPCGVQILVSQVFFETVVLEVQQSAGHGELAVTVVTELDDLGHSLFGGDGVL